MLVALIFLIDFIYYSNSFKIVILPIMESDYVSFYYITTQTLVKF